MVPTPLARLLREFEACANRSLVLEGDLSSMSEVCARAAFEDCAVPLGVRNDDPSEIDDLPTGFLAILETPETDDVVPLLSGTLGGGCGASNVYGTM